MPLTLPLFALAYTLAGLATARWLRPTRAWQQALADAMPYCRSRRQAALLVGCFVAAIWPAILTLGWALYRSRAREVGR